MFRLENPHYLQFLWLVLALLLVSAWGFRRSRKKISKAFGAKLSPFLSASISEKKRRWKLILQACCLGFMIITLTRPQSGQSKQEIKSEGVEIMILADVSESMLADDVRPSRLELAKVDMAKLTDLLSGNKIGLVAFAGAAALLSPLTSDPGSLKLFIDSLTTTSVSTQGTNFLGALQEAKAGFDRAGASGEEGGRVNRVILVMSDGEDHEPGALEYAKKLADEGTHIFAVAYGTEKGAPIPERDSLGYLKGYKKDQSGNTVLTTMSGKELQLLSEAGAGSFFFASPGGTYLQNLVEDISKIQKSQFETQMAVQYEEKFQWFCLVAFLMGLMELFLGERRSRFRLWRGRFEVPPA
jgi:Ca-activated chloride channel family protein